MPTRRFYIVCECRFVSSYVHFCVCSFVCTFLYCLRVSLRFFRSFVRLFVCMFSSFVRLCVCSFILYFYIVCKCRSFFRLCETKFQFFLNCTIPVYVSPVYVFTLGLVISVFDSKNVFDKRRKEEGNRNLSFKFLRILQ